MTKWVALTGRKLKPGSFDAWREAWERGNPPEGATAYICRSVSDPDEIVAFGMLEATADEIKALHEATSQEDDGGREAAMAPHVESVGTSGLYEVIEEITY